MHSSDDEDKHDTDENVQATGLSEPTGCTLQQHDEDDTRAMDEDGASDDAFEPLASYLADDDDDSNNEGYSE